MNKILKIFSPENLIELHEVEDLKQTVLNDPPNRRVFKIADMESDLIDLHGRNDGQFSIDSDNYSDEANKILSEDSKVQQFLNIILTEICNDVSYVALEESPFYKSLKNQDIHKKTINEIEIALALNKQSTFHSDNLTKYFPSDYIHCLIASDSYSWIGYDDSMRSMRTEAYFGLKQNDWRLYENLQVCNGRARIPVYVNKSSKQFVVSYLGFLTQFKLKHFFETRPKDYIESLSNLSTDLFVSLFFHLKRCVELSRTTGYSLSFTGYALSAFLAELSVFICHKYFNETLVKAVTFESFGSKECLEKLNEINHKKIDLNFLSIKSYLVDAPNFVNTLEEHLGKLFFIRTPELETYANLDMNLKDQLKCYAKNLNELDGLKSLTINNLKKCLNSIKLHKEAIFSCELWPKAKFFNQKRVNYQLDDSRLNNLVKILSEKVYPINEPNSDIFWDEWQAFSATLPTLINYHLNSLYKLFKRARLFKFYDYSRLLFRIRGLWLKEKSLNQKEHIDRQLLKLNELNEFELSFVEERGGLFKRLLDLKKKYEISKQKLRMNVDPISIDVFYDNTNQANILKKIPNLFTIEILYEELEKLFIPETNFKRILQEIKNFSAHKKEEIDSFKADFWRESRKYQNDDLSNAFSNGLLNFSSCSDQKVIFFYGTNDIPITLAVNYANQFISEDNICIPAFLDLPDFSSIVRYFEKLARFFVLNLNVGVQPFDLIDQIKHETKQNSKVTKFILILNNMDLDDSTLNKLVQKFQEFGTNFKFILTTKNKKTHEILEVYQDTPLFFHFIEEDDCMLIFDISQGYELKKIVRIGSIIDHLSELIPLIERNPFIRRNLIKKIDLQQISSLFDEWFKNSIIKPIGFHSNAFDKGKFQITDSNSSNETVNNESVNSNQISNDSVRDADTDTERTGILYFEIKKLKLNLRPISRSLTKKSELIQKRLTELELIFSEVQGSTRDLTEEHKLLKVGYLGRINEIKGEIDYLLESLNNYSKIKRNIFGQSKIIKHLTKLNELTGDESITIQLKESNYNMNSILFSNFSKVMNTLSQAINEVIHDEKESHPIRSDQTAIKKVKKAQITHEIKRFEQNLVKFRIAIYRFYEMVKANNEKRERIGSFDAEAKKINKIHLSLINEANEKCHGVSHIVESCIKDEKKLLDLFENNALFPNTSKVIYELNLLIDDLELESISLNELNEKLKLLNELISHLIKKSEYNSMLQSSRLQSCNLEF